MLSNWKNLHNINFCRKHHHKFRASIYLDRSSPVLKALPALEPSLVVEKRSNKIGIVVIISTVWRQGS